jgi:galactitol-specific phosphotransferase system IIB component
MAESNFTFTRNLSAVDEASARMVQAFAAITTMKLALNAEDYELGAVTASNMLWAIEVLLEQAKNAYDSAYTASAA